ncbi:MAG TPA: Trk system potassium transporter TrkA [Gammaproteobacteria bacterium]|nr:Trk system potassium transporter TrkA [Gammaproteobacteria bacterium]
MKIIILGAGQVGTTLAEHLATEHNDITIIDINGERLRSLQERMDILTIMGNAAYPSTLKRGGAEDADMLIAVTNNDETNLVACQVAATLFQIPTKIARVRSLHYLAHEELFGASAFPVDVLISPEQVISNYIRRLIEYPDALQVLDFANQKLQLVAVKTKVASGPMISQPLKNLPTYLGDIDTEIAAIFRRGTSITPTGSTIIEPNDEIFFLAERQNIRSVMSALIPLKPANQRIIIVGGGNIGTRLATALEKEFEVKVIEHNPIRIESLATHLTTGIVLEGDAADKELLLSENIENTDVFCAVTNKDETNIMSALLAKRLGAHKAMALITRPSYLDLVEGGDIDVVISPQQVTVGTLLTHIRRGHIVKVHSLRRGTTEAIEMIVDGNKETSKVVGRYIKDVLLPEEASILAIVRKNRVIMGHHNAIIETGDRVIVLLFDKRKIRKVERLFQEDNTRVI